MLARSGASCTSARCRLRPGGRDAGARRCLAAAGGDLLSPKGYL